MSSDLAIEAHGLGKRYRIGAGSAHDGTLRGRISAAASGFARRLTGRDGPDGPSTDLWAIRDLTFTIARGEVVGIVGGNGAGKSTLLRVLSRITSPTEGEALIRGRVGTLLEVSTGFHPELTGRENVFLNGAILGMSRAEVARKFDDIVEFAGVSRFIDTAVRFYSSGMYVRLAFAVAAHMEPEILFVDEVLAVGDAQFQKKCLGKMSDVSREGRTILFVSHNMEAVQRLCTRGLLMKGGRLVADGTIGDVVAQYRASFANDDALGTFRTQTRWGGGDAFVEGLRLISSLGLSGRCPADEDLVFEADLAMDETGAGTLQALTLGLTICSEEGGPLCTVMSADDGGAELAESRSCTVRIRIPAPTFVPGKYRVGTFLGIPGAHLSDQLWDALEFEVLPPNAPWRPFALSAQDGLTCRRAAWSVHMGAPEHGSVPMPVAGHR
jgi:lipopolysaccharide transport system ATP-binding protein